MKINIIMSGIGKSGGTRVILDYAHYLSKNHDVCIYVCTRGSVHGHKLIFLPYVEYVIWKKSKKFEKQLPKGYVNIKNISFPNSASIRDADITIATLWLTAYWVNKLPASKGKKVYFIQEYEDWHKKDKTVNGINSYKLKFDKHICVSTMLHNKLKAYGIDAKVVINGLDPKEISNKKTTHNVLSIGFPYRDGDRKNMSTCMTVLNRIQENYKVKITSYGFKKPISWPDNFEFLEDPSRKQLFDFYSSIDIFYVPSLYEGWSLPVTEAMGHALPVVACKNFGSISEFGENMNNCVCLNEPKDVKEVTKKISTLIRDKELRISIGNNALKTIEKFCNMDKSRYKFEQILKDLTSL